MATPFEGLKRPRTSGEPHDGVQSRRDFLSRLVLTEAEANELRCEPQRSKRWFKGRCHRLTGSRFGAAAGHNRYSSPVQLLEDMLFGGFTGNAATRYGTAIEPVALEQYECHGKVRRSRAGLDPDEFWVDDEGLNVCLRWPCFGVSPDGIVHDGERVYLLEIKCPYRRRLYPTIPHYYYDQIQGTMGLMRLDGRVLDGCDFVVYTDRVTRIEHFPYDADYFEGELFPSLVHFYMHTYLDMARLRDAGRLTRDNWRDEGGLVVVECEEGDLAEAPSAGQPSSPDDAAAFAQPTTTKRRRCGEPLASRPASVQSLFQL